MASHTPENMNSSMSNRERLVSAVKSATLATALLALPVMYGVHKATEYQNNVQSLKHKYGESMKRIGDCVENKGKDEFVPSYCPAKVPPVEARLVATAVGPDHGRRALIYKDDPKGLHLEDYKGNQQFVYYDCNRDGAVDAVCRKFNPNSCDDFPAAHWEKHEQRFDALVQTLEEKCGRR